MTLRTWFRMLGITVLAFSLPEVALAASSLDKVKQSGVIKVCLAQQQPDNYKDPRSGQWTGVMVDLLNELSKWMKVKTDIAEVGWDVAVLSLKQGTCDLFASSIVYTAPRAMEIAFVTPFGAKGDNIVIDKKNPKNIKVHADLNSPNITIIAELDWVKRGDADAAVLPTITARWWLNVAENAAWAAIGFPDSDFGNAPNGWAVRQGDQDWLDFLNSFSGWVTANGMAKQLYDEYLERTNPFTKKD